MRTASTLRIKSANLFRSSSRRPGRLQKYVCPFAIPKGILTTGESVVNSVHLNTYPPLHPRPDLEPEYFSARLTNDPAREPVAVGSSIPRTTADAAIETGREVLQFETVTN
jgi:hypothetical protein